VKRWRLFIALLVAVAIAAFALRYLHEKRAQAKHEIAYEAAVKSYSKDLRPGMTRREVEDYLSASGTPFRHMCCVNMKGSSGGVYDDLVKIGEEDVPFACSENNVYVAFEFLGPERRFTTAEPYDTLKDITVYHWLEGCM